MFLACSGRLDARHSFGPLVGYGVHGFTFGAQYGFELPGPFGLGAVADCAFDTDGKDWGTVHYTYYTGAVFARANIARNRRIKPFADVMVGYEDASYSIAVPVGGGAVPPPGWSYGSGKRYFGGRAGIGVPLGERMMLRLMAGYPVYTAVGLDLRL